MKIILLLLIFSFSSSLFADTYCFSGTQGTPNLKSVFTTKINDPSCSDETNCDEEDQKPYIVLHIETYAIVTLNKKVDDVLSKLGPNDNFHCYEGTLILQPSSNNDYSDYQLLVYEAYAATEIPVDAKYIAHDLAQVRD